MTLRDSILALLGDGALEPEGGGEARDPRDMPVFDEGTVPSLKFLQILMVIEAELGRSLDPGELKQENFATIRAIEAFVARSSLG